MKRTKMWVWSRSCDGAVSFLALQKTLKATGNDKVWPLNVIVPTIDRMSFIWNNFSLYRTAESQVSTRANYIIILSHCRYWSIIYSHYGAYHSY